mgnify:FL=1|tara:strand:+ start:395 stop:592 length:198 start_codon:yes stop_codon:yes gene_type:complete
MATTGQINREAIIRVEGEIKLLKQEIQTLRGNHLAHLEMRVSRMEKVMWSICLIATTHLLYSLLQ